jgi:ribosome-binding factor A
MEESKRQKQVARLVHDEMNEIFQKEGLTIFEGGMVSIAKVIVTPDLLEARFYLSLFQVPDTAKFLHVIKEQKSALRHALGLKVKNQLRRVPDLQFFLDDTLDYVFKMEAIFKQIEEEKLAREAAKKKEE